MLCALAPAHLVEAVDSVLQRDGVPRVDRVVSGRDQLFQEVLAEHGSPRVGKPERLAERPWLVVHWHCREEELSAARAGSAEQATCKMGRQEGKHALGHVHFVEVSKTADG
jgi:hypothetical protein